jgi:hypothetical protein
MRHFRMLYYTNKTEPEMSQIKHIETKPLFFAHQIQKLTNCKEIHRSLLFLVK